MIHSTFLLPWPPSVNSMFGQAPGHRRYPSKKYKHWTAAALEAITRQKVEEKYTGPVSFTLAFGRPDKRIRDLSNYIKGVEDICVKAGILADDQWIHRGVQYWDHNLTNCVQVEIHEL